MDLVQRNQKTEPLSEGEKERIQNLLESLHLNLAQTAFKRKQYSKAIEHASHVLHHNPSHSKALYRRSVAYLNHGDIGASRKDFQTLLNHSSHDDQDIQQLEKWIRKEEQLQIKKERECYQKMFVN